MIAFLYTSITMSNFHSRRGLYFVMTNLCSLPYVHAIGSSGSPILEIFLIFSSRAGNLVGVSSSLTRYRQPRRSQLGASLFFSFFFLLGVNGQRGRADGQQRQRYFIGYRCGMRNINGNTLAGVFCREFGPSGHQVWSSRLARPSMNLHLE